MKYRHKIEAVMIKAVVFAAAAMTLTIVAGIVAYVLMKGIPHLNPGLFERTYTSENCSLYPAIINTITIVLLSLGISVPIGIGGAIYLVEYAKRGNPFVKMVYVTAEALAGIPSIVYGLFGYLFFVTYCKMQYSLLAGALTLSIMVLPVILKTTQEALNSVPDSYREGSFGLGAGKLRTVFLVVLPSAIPGVLAGIILSIGRMVGETAALIFTAGSVAQIPTSLMGSGRTLAVHLYALWNEGLSTNAAYATAVVLLVVVVIINILSNLIGKKLQGVQAGKA